MSTSQLQELVKYRILGYIDKDQVFENHRPEWLRAESGWPLELDFYIENLNLAFEVQGRQHYEFVRLFHGTKAGFEDQLERDQLKEELCASAGICLIHLAAEAELYRIDDAILSRQKTASRKVSECIRLGSRHFRRQLDALHGFAKTIEIRDDSLWLCPKIRGQFHDSATKCWRYLARNPGIALTEKDHKTLDTAKRYLDQWQDGRRAENARRAKEWEAEIKAQNARLAQA